ncbi:hypothetical protein DFA_05814 [Cavenderia fasciculata]|uniref:Uncharacterized protein n=1 Tax=Cavenderia fasciculata TaxID=261658 RepID=F4PMT6_CACFS|nr:uncharacterized protein DFA_05814 [Cavenderia fasciculata]EGG23680.1 hypothetical protein DFA_05814 [Cavenderia fasciculata]|eukprot:XP_004361531.1 hypothetical protein DFA_05814 [Cavenderia fasciculata]
MCKDNLNPIYKKLFENGSLDCNPNNFIKSQPIISYTFGRGCHYNETIRVQRQPLLSYYKYSNPNNDYFFKYTPLLIPFEDFTNISCLEWSGSEPTHFAIPLFQSGMGESCYYDPHYPWISSCIQSLYCSPLNNTCVDFNTIPSSIDNCYDDKDCKLDLERCEYDSSGNGNCVLNSMLFNGTTGTVCTEKAVDFLVCNEMSFVTGKRATYPHCGDASRCFQEYKDMVLNCYTPCYVNPFLPSIIVGGSSAEPEEEFEHDNFEMGEDLPTEFNPMDLYIDESSNIMVHTSTEQPIQPSPKHQVYNKHKHHSSPSSTTSKQQDFTKNMGHHRSTYLRLGWDIFNGIKF